MNLLNHYLKVRHYTEELMQPLQREDFLAQPTPEVSPPKWHLGHTTWFFETLLLKQHLPHYQEFDSQFPYYFNSYYESMGQRLDRSLRGSLTRPALEIVYEYRKHVDDAMAKLLGENTTSEIEDLLELGLNHEQQHQELFLTDIKFILHSQPFYPVYNPHFQEGRPNAPAATSWQTVEEGLYEIGHNANGFSYDNERPRHKVFLPSYEIATAYITNGEWLEFMDNGGYESFAYWHSEAWDWIKKKNINAPQYWFKEKGQWMQFGLAGAEPVNPKMPVSHISFYEAAAFAEWKGMRLPTEAEWEIASSEFNWGQRWEWTNSAYLPYPGFRKLEGPAGEYNGKFMVNQMVLRGASVATSPHHSRKTYRNFFHPPLRWQFTGLRLAR